MSFFFLIQDIRHTRYTFITSADDLLWLQLHMVWSPFFPPQFKFFF